MARTPALAWPRPPRRSRYALLDRAPEDPLRVAYRVQADKDDERIRKEAKSKIAAGEDFSATLEWLTNRLADEREACWIRLSASFDAVIETLEGAKQDLVIRRLIAEAKRMRRAAGAERANQGSATP